MKIKFVALCFFLVSVQMMYSLSSFAQTDSLPCISVTANVDLMSRYIWRGQNYGQSPSIQPGVSATWKGFTLGAWGAYKFTGPGEQETDFYLSKSICFVTISVWDYWTFSDTSMMDFFNYHYGTTSHLLEGQILLSGGEKLPFNFLASYFFYGADLTRSIYLELQFVHSFGSIDMQLFTGYQLKGEYYAPVPAFVNIGCTVVKNIPLTKRWSLPVSVSFIVNPYCKSAYLLAGITL
jgi:hypothetical protein